MDNLDRTNVVQGVFAKYSLIQQLRELGILPQTDVLEAHPDFERTRKNVWADNADAISKQYSGTGALKNDFTRTGKRTTRGLIDDGVNSATRYYLNNFRDGDRQDAYDLLLAVHDPAKRGKFEDSPFAVPRAVPTSLLGIFVAIGLVLLLITAYRPEEPLGWLGKLAILLVYVALMFASYKLAIANGVKLVNAPRLVKAHLKD